MPQQHYPVKIKLMPMIKPWFPACFFKDPFEFVVTVICHPLASVEAANTFSLVIMAFISCIFFPEFKKQTTLRNILTITKAIIIIA
jgi:hypothetical protein